MPACEMCSRGVLYIVKLLPYVSSKGAFNYLDAVLV